MTVRATEDQRVFRDPERQEEFDTQGYTVVPFLSADEVQGVLDGYAEIVPEADEAIIAFDYTRDDRRVMHEVAALLSPVFARHIPSHFLSHEAIFWTFVIKPASPHSEMCLHDDRTYVDASRHRACTVWIPLVDTSPELENGCLCVVPGSHRIMPAASGTNIPNWIEPYDSYLKRYARPVAVPAGSGLIYDTKTLHWSPPNLSDQPRPAIAAAVVPSGEQLVHVVGEGLHRRRVYAVDRQFFVDHHPYSIEQGMPPGYDLLEEYWEERVSADPAAVALVGDPGDVPVPAGPAVAAEPRDYPGHASEPSDEGAEPAVTPESAEADDPGAASPALTMTPPEPVGPGRLRSRLRGFLARR